MGHRPPSSLAPWSLAGLRFATLVLCAASPAPAQPPGAPAAEVAAIAATVLDDGAIAWRRGPETLFVLRPRDAWRPLVWPACAPGGIPVLRRWPFEETTDEERDHPHHRGLWIAHGDVDGHDFWSASERKGTGRIEASVLESDGRGATLRCAWRSADGQVVLEDTRRYGIGALTDAFVLDVDVEFHGGRNGVRLGDTKEGTFALRLAEPLRVRGRGAKGRLRNATGLRDAEVWGRRAAWISATGRVGDVAVAVTMIDHPRNPRYPTHWHARDYGLLAANPFGVHDFTAAPKGTGDLVIPPGEAVRFRWRCLFHRGAPSDETLADLAARFAAEDPPRPSRR